jgi:lipopolysaccharide transport system ATP-binding protein
MSKVLEVKNISKSFKDYSSEFKRILSWFGLKFKPAEEHQILKHINFSIAPGESVGIVGQNGAGKSTLLKIITGTLKASEGRVTVYGKIAAILELGMGFNPDLSGRQNAHHSAGLMGYSIDEIKTVIDEIKAFAEIGEYFEQPVRTYSSGMQARVAFAVATAFRPEILIVDEALSVGDVYFQSKCFSRMEWMKKSGTTILLVSHDTQAIRSFCDRAILLHRGQMRGDGTPKDIVQLYEHITNDFSNKLNEEKSIETQQDTLEKKQRVKLSYFKLMNINSEEIQTVTCNDQIIVEFAYFSYEDFDDPHYGVRISDRFGNSAFETNTFCMKKKTDPIKKENQIIINFLFEVNLGVGDYMIDVAMTNGGYNKMYFNDYLSMEHNVGTIKVVNNEDNIIFAGYYNMNPQVIFKKAIK